MLEPSGAGTPPIRAVNEMNFNTAPPPKSRGEAGTERSGYPPIRAVSEMNFKIGLYRLMMIVLALKPPLT